MTHLTHKEAVERITARMDNLLNVADRFDHEGGSRRLAQRARDKASGMALALGLLGESPEVAAYEVARRRLRGLHTSLAGQREDWAKSSMPSAAARAVAYQSAMQSVHSIIDEIEAIAGGAR